MDPEAEGLVEAAAPVGAVGLTAADTEDPVGLPRPAEDSACVAACPYWAPLQP